MKTYSAKPSEITRAWHLVDAADAPLGRLATEIAQLLSGKKKPTFTSHMDTGDYVVVVNCDNLVVTGNKEDQKMYYRHSGYIGNLKETKLSDQRSKDSTKILVAAVRGMLPVNKLRDGRLTRLKVYGGMEHQHTAQQPTVVSLKRVVKAKKATAVATEGTK